MRGQSTAYEHPYTANGGSERAYDESGRDAGKPFRPCRCLRLSTRRRGLSGGVPGDSIKETPHRPGEPFDTTTFRLGERSLFGLDLGGSSHGARCGFGQLSYGCRQARQVFI